MNASDCRRRNRSIEHLGDPVQPADIRRFRDEYDVRPPTADDLEAPSDDESAPSTSTGCSTSTDSERVSPLMDDLHFDDED